MTIVIKVFGVIFSIFAMDFYPYFSIIKHTWIFTPIFTMRVRSLVFVRCLVLAGLFAYILVFVLLVCVPAFGVWLYIVNIIQLKSPIKPFVQSVVSSNSEND